MSENDTLDEVVRIIKEASSDLPCALGNHDPYDVNVLCGIQLKRCRKCSAWWDGNRWNTNTGDIL